MSALSCTSCSVKHQNRLNNIRSNVDLRDAECVFEKAETGGPLGAFRFAGPTPVAPGSHDASEHMHAVLEEPRSRLQQQPIPTSGPELANMMKIGTRVMRGLDWKWGDQVRVKVLCMQRTMSSRKTRSIGTKKEYT